MGFFYTALEELNDHNSETIRYNALAHRFSKLENNDFDKFMSEGDTDKPKKPVKVDHLAQMQMAKRT